MDTQAGNNWQLMPNSAGSGGSVQVLVLSGRITTSQHYASGTQVESTCISRPQTFGSHYDVHRLTDSLR